MLLTSRRYWAPIILALAIMFGLTSAAANPVHRIAADRPTSSAPDAITAGTTSGDAALAGIGKQSNAVRIALMLTLMAVLPALIISMTSFTRIIIVLSMIRHAFGMPETPPNQVLIGLSLFLAAFSMGPTFDTLYGQSVQPFLEGHIALGEAIDKGAAPLKTFMLRQVRDQDIAAIYSISHRPLPPRAVDVGLVQLVPAFMLNELRVSFRIGFVVFLPFLLIDLVVSSILLALGMLMVPPSTLSLPIKILMFVLIDGWSLVLQGVMGSFH